MLPSLFTKEQRERFALFQERIAILLFRSQKRAIRKFPTLLRVSVYISSYTSRYKVLESPQWQLHTEVVSFLKKLFLTFNITLKLGLAFHHYPALFLVNIYFLKSVARPTQESLIHLPVPLHPFFTLRWNPIFDSNSNNLYPFSVKYCTI